MRWLRRLVATVLGTPLVLIAAVLGTMLALLYAPPGRALTARLLTEAITARVAGTVTIGAIRGGILRHVVLEDVSIRDSTGAVVLAAPRLEVRYLLPELLAGRIILRELRADRPTIHLVRLRKGRWNYEEVFRSGGGPGGPPKRVELRNLVIRGGTLRVDVPTTPKPPKQPISRNGAMPARPEIDTTADGPVRVYRATALDARVPLARISTPTRDPLLVRVQSLAARLSDPAITLTDLRGEIVTGGDSLRFTFDRASLPTTEVRGAGAVRWPRDTILFDWRLEADTVALADLRFISPDFPDWVGRGVATARSSSGSRTDYQLDNLVLGSADGTTRAAGRLVAMVDNARGLGVRELDLALRDVPLEAMRPYLDTLPFAGRATGRLTADGFLDRMVLGGTLEVTDDVVRGAPPSTLGFQGTVRFGGAEGAVFEGFQLRESRIPLATIRRLVPAATVTGDLRLDGRLDGPWQNARFEGIAVHTAPDGAASRMVGQVRFDTRGTVLGLALDATFDSLSFDALRTGFPTLTPAGRLAGRVTANGTLDTLDLVADLAGPLGAIQAIGRIGALPPAFRADSLTIEATDLDLRQLLGAGLPTRLTGRMMTQGVLDSAGPPIGWATITLQRSTINGFRLDAADARLGSDGERVLVETARVSWPGEGQLTATGSLGWRAPIRSTLTIEATAASVAPFDSMARAVLGQALGSDTSVALSGQARLALELTGSLDSLSIAGTIGAEALAIDALRIAGGDATLALQWPLAGGLTLAATADTIAIGARSISGFALSARGVIDSLVLGASARYAAAELAVAGAWQRDTLGGVQRIRLDSLAATLPKQAWQLMAPARLVVAPERTTLADTIRLRTTDGSGAMTFAGTVPGDREGDLTGSIAGLDLADVMVLASTDSVPVSGYASLDFRLGGTRLAPTLRGDATLTSLRVAEARPPLARASFDYFDQRLRSRVAFWSVGEPVLEADISLPFDLALAARATRRLPGDLVIEAFADSAELVLLEAFTPSIRNTRGTLGLDLRVLGSWERPRLDGTVAVNEGRMTLPSLGVRYGPIDGRARFVDNAMVVDSLRVASGGGDMVASGRVRFPSLSRPELDLAIHSEGFLAIDVPNYLTLRPTGDVTITGPLLRPVMRGGAVLNNSILYFADLVNKNIVNLEDPALADLVDTSLVRRERLGAAFQNRFLDSLRIENLAFRVGTDVWLRSTEANIQLEGRVTVNKVRRQYRVDGEFTTPRGTYTLKVGPVTRDFIVDRGTVRYLGTPDLNADLDLQARHLVRGVDGDEIPVVARITGSIQVPRLALSSPGRNIPERDLMSYLMFGKPEFQVGGAQAQVLQAGAGLLSTELGRAFVGDNALDLFEIRPELSAGQSSLGGFTRLSAGKQLGPKWFVTFNAGFCFGGQQDQNISARNFGASLEYRFSRDWRVQASAEPVRACTRAGFGDAFRSFYQFGADLLWEREY
ncbi:MAG TPA: translocation/assembly module TamB [Gemmatimonadales bacterium]|nr:translocation/assembly module TamB [Gemmatimonadales bacterium]